MKKIVTVILAMVLSISILSTPVFATKSMAASAGPTTGEMMPNGTVRYAVTVSRNYPTYAQVPESISYTENRVIGSQVIKCSGVLHVTDMHRDSKDGTWWAIYKGEIIGYDNT